MKKVFLILTLVIILLFGGCFSNSRVSPENTTDNDISESSLTTSLKTEPHTTILSEEKTTSTILQDISSLKNTIVERPSYNKITTEIPKELVGKYVNSEDENAYFEIREDGTVFCKFPFHTGGYEVMDSDSISLLTFYKKNMIYLAFISVNEDVFLDYGIAISFYSGTHGELFSSDNNIGVYVRQ